MIPMCVGKQQGEVHRLGLELLEERLAQLAQAGARIQNNNIVAVTIFHATGIAPIAYGVRARCGNRTPGT